MSFLLDPPLLVAAGAAIERWAPGERAARVASASTVAAFVGVSAALYADLAPLVRRWPTLGARDGREFMLTSGLGRAEHERMSPFQHAAALSLFALYPAWLELGRRAVRAPAR